MKHIPGTPLHIALRANEAEPDLPVARLALADRLAQLEWSPYVIQRALRISLYLYPPEPGLVPARTCVRRFARLSGR